MLVLSRKQGQTIRIGDSVEMVVIKVHGNRVQLGFTAPPDVAIHREEVYSRSKGQSADLQVESCPPTSVTSVAEPVLRLN